jgi:hypothetical protein
LHWRELRQSNGKTCFTIGHSVNKYAEAAVPMLAISYSAWNLVRFLIPAAPDPSDVNQIAGPWSSLSMEISFMACHLLSTDWSSQRPIKGQPAKIVIQSTDRGGQPVVLRNSF